MTTFDVRCGDALTLLQQMPDESVQCCITSPPYWGLRDYGMEGQLGMERTPEEYIVRLCAVFSEVRRVLSGDGTLWLNLGDSYAGSWGAQSRGNTTGERTSTLQGSSMLSARQIAQHPHLEGGTGSLKRTPGIKTKDLVGIPWMVAFALRADGWYLRSDIIWSKPNPMPESVTDRPTKAHEYLFLLSNGQRYYYDSDAIKEPAIYADDDRKARANPANKELQSTLSARMNPRSENSAVMGDDMPDSMNAGTSCIKKSNVLVCGINDRCGLWPRNHTWGPTSPPFQRH